MDRDALSQLLFILLALKRRGGVGEENCFGYRHGGCLNTEVGRLRRDRREAKFEESTLNLDSQ